MQHGYEHLSGRERAVAPHETIGVRFTGVIKAHWSVSDQGDITETTLSFGAHVGAKPTLIYHLLAGSYPRLVPVGLAGRRRQFFGRPSLGMKPAESRFTRSHRRESHTFGRHRHDLWRLDLTVIRGDDEGRP